ncbi:XRE family transcriptional regulator [Streptomyces sp. CC228A]|uniref:helix-turn-helix domain-containing protein n=1 Tax=Streptomyces sp. CC228A TaxID=2898186 RepID=UPI001F1B007B|nr:XRE family transcriptional regulator [Streptomyces sp. CC228A]
MTPPGASGASREWRVLARELRALKDRSGLSMAALAARTTASKSSWQRYLSGALPPPRELVRELCVLSDEPPGRLLALWDLADLGRRHATESEPESEAEPESAREAESEPEPRQDPGGGPRHGPVGERRQEGRSPARARRWGVAVGVVAAVLGGVGAAVGTGPVWPPGPGERAAVGGCSGAGCEGLGSYAQGCGTTAARPRTVVERRVVGGRMVSVRHSAACEATWARVWLADIGDRLEVHAPDGRLQRAEIGDKYDAEGYFSTPMLGGGPDGVRACVVLARTGDRHCVGG